MKNDDWFSLMNRLAAANPAFWALVGGCAVMLVLVVLGA